MYGIVMRCVLFVVTCMLCILLIGSFVSECYHTYSTCVHNNQEMWESQNSNF